MKDNVLAAIRALPENQRIVTALFYINGYSQNEIADFLEVPVTTVNNRLHRSRKRLKERMITMVQDTLHENRPSRDDGFVKKVGGFLHIVCPPNYSPHGFLRPAIGAPPSPDDIYVTPRQIRRFIPKNGDFIVGTAGPPKPEKGENYSKLLTIETINDEPFKKVEGFLHIEEAGHGFLRPAVDASPSLDDIYVQPSEIVRFSLSHGDFIEGQARPTKQGGEKVWQRYRPLVKIETINHKPVKVFKKKFSGFLHVEDSGKGFVRGFVRPTMDAGPSLDDIYIDDNLIQIHQLKHGDFITGEAHPPLWTKEHQACYFALDKIETINHERVEIEN